VISDGSCVVTLGRQTRKTLAPPATPPARISSPGARGRCKPARPTDRPPLPRCNARARRIFVA
jgi:hypothetical protein